MPHSILVLMIQFMLLLLLCTMSNMYVFVIFHSMPWSNFIFPTKLIFYLFTHKDLSWWLSCTKYRLLLLSFLPRIWARLDQTLGSSSIWITVISAVPAIHISAKPRLYAINNTTFTVCKSLDLSLQASNGHRFTAISHFIDDQLNIILEAISCFFVVATLATPLV